MPKDTLAEIVFQAARGGPCSNLDGITDDVIRCLDRLNQQMRQEAAHRQTVACPLVYAASGVVWICLDKAMGLQRSDPQSHAADALLKAAWRIQCAWDALLAGDVEDLQRHVALEEMARGY